MIDATYFTGAAYEIKVVERYLWPDEERIRNLH